MLGQAREQPRPQRALGVAERGERLLEPGDVGGVGGDRHVEAPAGAERGAGQDLGVAGDLHRLVERRAGPGLAGLPAHVAEGDQEVRAAVHLERLPEVPGGFLVGVRGDRLAGGGGAVLDRGLRPADLAGGEEVVRELAGRGAGGLERAAGAQVQADAAGVGGRVVERLAHERVGEGEAIDLLGVLAHDAGAQRLLQRVEQLLARPPHHRLERGEAEVAAEHRGGGQRLDGLRLEPREAARDQVLDALGHALGLGRLGQAAQHLLDEERVAGGAAVEAVGELGVADELRGVRLLQAAERDPLDHVLAAEVGEQPRRVGDEVGLLVAHRHQHEQRRPLEAADDVAEQQQRRHARPLEVLDDEQQRPLGGDAPEQRGDGLEQPVAAVLPLARLRGDAAQLRDQRGERLEVHARHRRRVGHVVAERFDERLERDDGLLVDPPVQHRSAARVRLGGEARREPGLPHARLAHDHDDRALPQLPRPPQRAELGRAADERALLARGEDGRQRQPGSGRRRGRRLVLHQQPVVQRGDVGRRGRAELVAQQHAQLVVDPQRLGEVAARRQQLHQQRVAGLAVRLALDQRPRRAIGGRQLAAAQPQRRAGQRLQRVGVQPVELGALLVDPAPRELGQQRPLEALQRRARPLGRAPRVARRQRLLGLGRGRARLVEVHPHLAARAAGARGPRPRRAPAPAARA